MAAVLFVHQDPGFKTRIESEAELLPHSRVLIHNSLQGSLKTITDPSVLISAIYVSIHGLDLSLFRVIEQLLVLRPVTPLFLLDHEMNPGIRTLSIQGAFHSNLSLEALLQPLKRSSTPTDRSIDQQRNPVRATEGFLAVPFCDFLELEAYPYDTFTIPSDGSQIRVGARGDAVDTSLLSRMGGKVPFLYLRREDLFSAQSVLHDVQSRYLDFEPISEDWKTSEILVEARRALVDLRKESLSDLTVERTLFFLERLMSHLENLDAASPSDALRRFLFQAGNRDQALGTLSLAILYCSRMKFQRSSAIEILGLASLLQDISLYQSPFGDLSVKNPGDFTFEEKAYFINHPVISADLVAANTSLSEVVVQVIRQHHERKDRTGFPNATGGPRLHPVAEILSLLNLYLEFQNQGLTGREFAQKLVTDVLCHYSKAATGPFLKMIEEFSFTKRVGSV